MIDLLKVLIIDDSPDTLAIEAITLDLGPDTLRTTSSFGVAEAALYRAKSDGRNCVRCAAHTPNPVGPAI
ncbi:MAG: hypothetical protein GWP14_00790 [Actinobacteria bacterium]|nr:hypothetical protein [Actinomycetota bacterium]